MMCSTVPSHGGVFNRCVCVLVLLVAWMPLVGCQPSVQPVRTTTDEATADATGEATAGREIALQLNWYPESEHGGVYQAQADGTYKKAGFRVDIRPGGRATPVAPELELQRVQFAMANADDVVLFRQQGMDIVAVMAVMQNSPRCILVQSQSGVNSFDELTGLTLQRQTGRLFVEFMRSKGVLDQVKEVPYHGSAAALVSDPKIAIQAYSFAEPFLAKQQGVEVTAMMVSDLGWNPYSSVLITSGEMIRKRPEDVQDFVTATRQGWRNYLSNGTLGNQAILEANSHGMTQEVLRYGAEGLASLALPDETPVDSLGSMTYERWRTLVEQIHSLQPNAPLKVKAEECFTLQFL